MFRSSLSMRMTFVRSESPKQLNHITGIHLPSMTSVLGQRQTHRHPFPGQRNEVQAKVVFPFIKS